MTIPDQQIPDHDAKVKPDVNIVVCADEYGCQRWYSQGRNAADVLQELHDAVALEHGERVQITTAGCILGCTYGPRFDVARRWSGEKALYGAIAGEASITRRGRVRFAPIPAELSQVISDNLPETAVPLAELGGVAPAADIDLLRQILLDCSRGIDRAGSGLNEAIVMVHNSAAVVSIPATLADLELIDGDGRQSELGDIAVLTTDGDGRAADPTEPHTAGGVHAPDVGQRYAQLCHLDAGRIAGNRVPHLSAPFRRRVQQPRTPPVVHAVDRQIRRPSVFVKVAARRWPTLSLAHVVY